VIEDRGQTDHVTVLPLHMHWTLTFDLASSSLIVTKLPHSYP